MEGVMLNIYENSNALKSKGLTSAQIALVNQIEYDRKDQTWWIGKIVQYVTLGYPLTVLVKNQIEIRNLGRDSSSLRSYIIRFGETIGGELFNKKICASTVTASKMIEKLGEEGASEFYSKRGSSLENFVVRYGIMIGTEKWNNYLVKRAAAYRRKKEDGHNSRNKFKIKKVRSTKLCGGVTWNSANLQFRSINLQRSCWRKRTRNRLKETFIITESKQ